jgi:DNA-binding CsgD family transcriptional regulator
MGSQKAIEAGQKKRRKAIESPRNMEVVDLFNQGLSFAEIGRRFGFTRERARAIYARWEKCK